MYDEIRDDLVRICRLAHYRGLVSGAQGNLSVRTPDGRGILIKARGACFRTLTPLDLLFIDWRGGAFNTETLAPTTRRPSMELRMHLWLYELSETTKAIVHAHSPCAAALSLSDEHEIPLATAEAQERLRNVPIIPDHKAGSDELASAVRESFSHGGVTTAVIRGHGPVAVGATIDEAYDRVEEVEHECSIAVIAHKGGI